MKKRLLLLFTMIACVFSLVACTGKDVLDYDKDSYKKTMNEIIETMSSMSDDDLSAALSELKEGSNEYNMLKTWIDSKKELGELKSIDEYTFTSENNTITCKVDATYEKHDGEISFVFYLDNEEDNTVTFSVVYTLSEKIEKACLNTLLGMGTVFVVLVLISILISMFKIINNVETSMKSKKNAVTATEAVDNTIAQIVEKEEELSDDLELVAVIAAAIAASEGRTSTDGLYVRSIKRVNKSKWQRA